MSSSSGAAVVDDMATWEPSSRCRDVPSGVCDMLASEHGMSFRASVVVATEALPNNNHPPPSRRDDAFPPESLVSSAQRFNTEVVRLSPSSSIPVAEGVQVRVVQPCYTLDDLRLPSALYHRLERESSSTTTSSSSQAGSTPTPIPTITSLRSLQQYAIPFFLQHSQHQHNRRATAEASQTDLICQSALVLAAPVASGKSTAAAIALATLLYGRRGSFFASQTPVASAPTNNTTSSQSQKSHNQGGDGRSTRPLTGRVLAVVLVGSREAEDLWRGLLEKQLGAVYDRGTTTSSHHGGSSQSRPLTVVGRSILDHAAAVGGSLVNGRSHNYPGNVSPVVIVQNVFQLDGLGKAWGSSRDGRLTDFGGMPIGFLNTVETVVLDGVESIVTPPLSSTVPLGVWALLRRLGQRGLGSGGSSSSGSAQPQGGGGEVTVDGDISRGAIVEKQRALPYLSRPGFSSFWVISGSHTCAMLGSGLLNDSSAPIGFHSSSSSAGVGAMPNYYASLQHTIGSHVQQQSSTPFVSGDFASCCDVETSKFNAISSRMILSPLMAGNMHRNLIRLVGGLMGRGAMLECGQLEEGRWHSVLHRVQIAKASAAAALEVSRGVGGGSIEAPPFASMIAKAVSQVAKGTTVVAVRNKSDATAMTTIVRLILSGAMKVPESHAFPTEWWTKERVLRFPTGGREGPKVAKDLAYGLNALKASLKLNNPDQALTPSLIGQLRAGAEKLVASATTTTTSSSSPSPTKTDWVDALEFFDRNVVFVTEWHIKTGSYPRKLSDVRHVINCLWDVSSYRLPLPPSWGSSPPGGGNGVVPSKSASSNNSTNAPHVSFELEGLTHTLSHLFGSHSYMNMMTTVASLDTATAGSGGGGGGGGDATGAVSGTAGSKRDRSESTERNKVTDMLRRLAAFLAGTKQPVPCELVNVLEDISLGL